MDEAEAEAEVHPTLIFSHFVPGLKERTGSRNFYKVVKLQNRRNLQIQIVL